MGGDGKPPRQKAFPAGIDRGGADGIWESHENPQKMATAMDASPELKKLFPEHAINESGW